MALPRTASYPEIAIEGSAILGSTTLKTTLVRAEAI